jgi:hypothetical protein
MNKKELPKKQTIELGIRCNKKNRIDSHYSGETIGSARALYTITGREYKRKTRRRASEFTADICADSVLL